MNRENVIGLARLDGKRLRRALALALAPALILPPWAAVTVHAQTVYVYRNARGTVLITDHPHPSPGYTLVRHYAVGDAGGGRRAATARARDSDFDEMIERVARRNRLDGALVKAVVHAESAFDPTAVSRRGAVGLMQLMPTIAAAYGVADRTDPWQNLLAGSRHLKRLLERYRDTALALAAYNAGTGAVTRFGGIPPYPETETYVRKVLRLQALYRQQG